MSSSKKYNFSGKVALVTGSSSGIGAAIALQFAQYGARVTITGRDTKNLASVSQEIKKASGQEPLQVVGDLLDESFAPRLVAETVAKFGRLDILVNNAGGGDPNDKDYDNPDLLDAYDKIMKLNVRSVLQLTQVAVPHLEKTKGNVINISSIGAIAPIFIIYSTSKAALDMLTRTSAGKLAKKGIRVNSINPGGVKTAIYRSMGMDAIPEEHRKALSKTPLGFFAEPVEIANLASFLASDDARNITGSIMVTDTGALVKPQF